MATLLSYGNQLMDDLERQLEAARVKPEVEVVHKLRVIIKKIRALLTFLGRYDETFNEKKAIKKVKKIFKPAGRLRDMQVQHSLLKKYRSNAKEAISHFFKETKEDKEEAEKALKKALRKFDAKKMRDLRAQWESAATGMEEEKLEQLCEDFVQQRLATIAGLTNSRPEGEQLHQIRKYLKEIVYVQQILKSTDHQLTLSKSAYKKLKDMQEAFGSWHDLQVLFDKLLHTEWEDCDPTELFHAVQADKIMSEVMITRHLKRSLSFSWKPPALKHSFLIAKRGRPKYTEHSSWQWVLDTTEKWIVMKQLSCLFWLPFVFLISSIGIQCSGDWNRKPEIVNDGVAVVVLGIAQDAGYPQANCHKVCCQPVWNGEMKPQYTACLALIDAEAEKVWMIDATPDFKEQLQLLQEKLPFTPDPFLDGIFLTHAHIGHYTGLMHLGREVMGASNVPVYAMPRMCDFLAQNGPWSQLVSLENIELKTLHADSALQLTPTLTLTPLLVPHRDEYSETVGFRVEGPKRSLLFIPDIDKWEKWDRSILAELETVDLAFLDGTFFSNGEIPGRDMSEIPHPFIMESMALFEDLPRKKKASIHFIHFNHTNMVLREGAERWLVEDNGFHLARQGSVFPL